MSGDHVERIRSLSLQFRDYHKYWPRFNHRIFLCDDRTTLVRYAIYRLAKTKPAWLPRLAKGWFEIVGHDAEPAWPPQETQDWLAVVESARWIREPAEELVRESPETGHYCYHVFTVPNLNYHDYAMGALGYLALAAFADIVGEPPQPRQRPDDITRRFLELLHHFLQTETADPTLRIIPDSTWNGNPLPPGITVSSLPHGVFLTTAMVLELKAATNPRDARDEFCYRSRLLGMKWGEITRMANERFQENPWTTGEAAEAAANRFAKKRNLPRPKPGRNR